MEHRLHRLRLTLLLAFGFCMPGFCCAGDQEILPPYMMLRSLQFVQDSVVLGDHSAGEMQEFMLTALDRRLRSAEKSVFDDVRNVDAAMIYEMSGGDPTTLEFLISHDTAGNFDSRVTEVLRKYLSGKGFLVVKTLAETATEYRDKKIGPYLSLVAANVMSAKQPKAALKFYDWARLTAPGTIVEEAALRRSVALTTKAGMVTKALGYSQRYARRFLRSPYAGQFADLFVNLVVKYDKDIGRDDIVSILAFMDAPHQREIYLRVARSAAIAGKLDLAAYVASRARDMTGDGTGHLQSLASFYGGVATILTPDIGVALRDINGIPESELDPRDRALRRAAKAVAQADLQPPDSDSLTQSEISNMSDEANIERDAIAAQIDAGAKAPDSAGVRKAPAAIEAKPPTGAGQDADPSFTSFVSASRAKLDAIDGLLEQESNW
jgi:chemotaxis protein MotC